ncbi:MAG: flagellar biosynthetic protein FliO [Verrucomicrobia bacterium]|nr:flagellar biosynthetic protein FliO [Verrucomicrobiota bacterium]MBS0637423.1 flagellar biosynthetic protein FliO [Verrucomicrobiota bacterium]
MKKFIVCLVLLFTSSLHCAEEPPMPESFTQWEQENAGREVAEDSRYGELWSKTLLLLIVVLLVLFAGTYYLKRFGGNLGIIKAGASVKDSRIQLLEKKVISPKAVVYLLSIDGHKIALSETSAGIQVLKPLEHDRQDIEKEISTVS